MEMFVLSFDGVCVCLNNCKAVNGKTTRPFVLLILISLPSFNCCYFLQLFMEVLEKPLPYCNWIKHFEKIDDD